ncbi:hypothetical protein GWI33_010567 [Rhynchophorus ferrugineus]|uniref:Uncharacterized protein n=1 Tax=Rhynchophorus ferrugineus TaxID=354439 RepID=A0A834IUT8_RHYFE|nr:hypothetical protein GWI33_010567 [Rhynchophorus ferrugineus]
MSTEDDERRGRPKEVGFHVRISFRNNTPRPQTVQENSFLGINSEGKQPPHDGECGPDQFHCPGARLPGRLESDVDPREDQQYRISKKIDFPLEIYFYR